MLLPVMAFADTSDNILGTPSSVTYNVRQQNQVYTFSYTTGTVVFNGVLPEYDPLNVFTLNWSMDVRMPCNNSIGGYCSNPNGPEDTLDAFLGVSGDGYTETRQVLDLQDYFTEWRTVGGSESYVTKSPLTNTTFTVQGFDSGYWAGYYGPEFRSPSVIAVYTSIPTGPDCTNPLNDPSCSGYWDAVATSSVTDEYTDVVFGDEVEDYFFADEEEFVVEEPIYEEVFNVADEEVFFETKIEEEFFPENELDLEPKFENEIVEEPILETLEEAEPEYVEKPQVVETTEKTSEPAVDVLAIALNIVKETTENAVELEVEQVGVGVEMALLVEPIQQEVQNESQTPMQELSVSVTDMQFEQDFNDAIGAGQSINQFLSAQLPDFSRFDVAPPSQQEQRTTQRATQALQSMSQQDIAQSTEAQLEEMQESGGFSDQSLTVLLISNNPDFNQYNNISLEDRSQFYENKVIYRGNAPADNARALLRGSGTRTYEAMVDGQWQR